MNPLRLKTLLADVAGGGVAPEAAEHELLQAFRASPFEDIGVAHVDHHRGIRTGFPEVVLGLGKTPEQIAAIAREIVGRKSSLLVTRASAEAFAQVAAVVPGAVYHADARVIALQQDDVVPGIGSVLVVAAGTADTPIAEEAVRTLEVMGNQVDRLYDVGVAGFSGTNQLGAAGGGWCLGLQGSGGRGGRQVGGRDRCDAGRRPVRVPASYAVAA